MRVVLGATSGLVSGVDVFSANLARGLRARGVEALVLLSDEGAPTTHPMRFPDDVATFGVSLRSWDTETFLSGALYGAISAGPTVYLPNYDWSVARRLAPHLPSHVRVVGSVHSDDPVYYREIPMLAPHLDAIVAVSERTASRTRELLGGDPDGLVSRIPYGVPGFATPPLPGGETLRCIYVGRIVQEQKRVLDLVPIADGLVRAGVPFTLDIVGDGDERSELEQRMADHVASGRVTFRGTVDNDAVRSMLRESDVLLLTSAYEGLPVSLLEARHAGCIPVVTRIESGMQEVVSHGDTGYLLPVGDAEGFVAVLARLAADRSSRDAMRRRIHEHSTTGEHSVESMTDSYLQLFEELLARPPRAHRTPWSPASRHDVPMTIEERIARRVARHVGRIGRAGLRPARRAIRRARRQIRR